MESGWCYVQTIQKLEKELVELKKENERLKELLKGESQKGEHFIINQTYLKILTPLHQTKNP
jgi:cell shape-determining protein MreC